MLALFVLAALGVSIPQVDLNKICQNVSVDSLPEDRVAATRGCVGDEATARDQLRREWGRYSTADRGNCASTPGMRFSYVELLTCMEMQRGGKFSAGSQAGSPTQAPPLKPSSGPQKP
jgi:hypothetical protein